MESVEFEQVLENVVLPTKEKRAYFKSQALSRVGETRINNLGSLMIVDEYNNSQDTWVRFPQGHLVHCTWQQFITGSVKNVYDRSVFGVGFIGKGEYKPTTNGVPTQQYKVWLAMLQRCFSLKFKEENPTYKECTVADEWLNFQNFAKWYDENYYEINGERMSLDKDILVKGNKVYSPETCIFVPQKINILFIKRDAYRGSLPIGVRIDKTSKKNPYMARSGDGKGGQIFLRNHSTPEEAFQAYKEYKENLIKEIAKEHQDKIPSALFNAMMLYTVEIND